MPTTSSLNTTPAPRKVHRLNLTVGDELYARLARLSPHARSIRLDVVAMLAEYCDLRETYGKNIYEGIHRWLLTGK